MRIVWTEAGAMVNVPPDLNSPDCEPITNQFRGQLRCTWDGAACGQGAYWSVEPMDEAVPLSMVGIFCTKHARRMLRRIERVRKQGRER